MSQYLALKCSYCCPLQLPLLQLLRENHFPNVTGSFPPEENFHNNKQITSRNKESDSNRTSSGNEQFNCVIACLSNRARIKLLLNTFTRFSGVRVNCSAVLQLLRLPTQKHPCGAPDDRRVGLGVVTLRIGLVGTSNQGPRKLRPSQIPSVHFTFCTFKLLLLLLLLSATNE